MMWSCIAQLSGAFILVTIALLQYGSANAAEDTAEIKSLPGWNGPLPSRQFSGYIPVDKSGQRRMFYWLVESESNPATDPLVLWAQGGPGCSSLGGFFVENGPFLVVNDSAGGQKLVRREFPWNRAANTLFWESPIGCGYSYSTDKAYRRINDTETAEENLAFVLGFFDRYPQYRKRDFFITGESYAGVYIPMVAHLIVDYNRRASAEEAISLKGLAIGNGCIGSAVGACNGAIYDLVYALPYMYNHGLISPVGWQKLQSACEGQRYPSTVECARVINETYTTMGKIQSYDILAPCYLTNLTSHNLQGVDNFTMISPLVAIQRLRDKNRFLIKDVLPVNSLPDCGFGLSGAYLYLRRHDVMKALHVDPSQLPVPWAECTTYVEYESTMGSLLNSYPDLIKAVRILIYNGDLDTVVPYTDNEEWTDSMPFRAERSWHPWSVDGQVAGYKVNYEHGFTFATVKGSGHLVPLFKPKVALEMIQRFIRGDF